MAVSVSSNDSSEKLWPSPYSPTATLSTAKTVPQPTFVQTRNSIQSRPQEVRTKSPKPRRDSKSPETTKVQVESQQQSEGTKDEKSVRLWPSPYSKETHLPEQEQEQGEAGRGNGSRERVDESPEPENGKGVKVHETKKSIWRRLLCFGCFR